MYVKAPNTVTPQPARATQPRAAQPPTPSKHPPKNPPSLHSGHTSRGSAADDNSQQVAALPPGSRVTRPGRPVGRRRAVAGTTARDPYPLSGSITDVFRSEGYEWATTSTATGHDDRSDRHAPRLPLRAPVALAGHSPSMEPTKKTGGPGYRPRSKPSNWHPKSAESSALWIESPPMLWPAIWLRQGS